MKPKTFEKTLMLISALVLPTFATFILFLQINNQKQKIELIQEQLEELNKTDILED